MKKITNALLLLVALLSLSVPSQAQTGKTRKHHTVRHVQARRRTSRKATPTLKKDTSAKVWLNDETLVYHRAGTRWYGNTKSGRYVSENEALKTGAHVARNGQ